MTEISEAAKAKADAMLKEADPRSLQDGKGNCAYWIHDALARFIQEVSDAAKIVAHHYNRPSSISLAAAHLAPFILPEPVDPVKALDDIIRQHFQWHNAGRPVIEELEALGFEIRPKQ